jgi:5'-nucleotidase (lipoprotein e(P4) family)
MKTKLLATACLYSMAIMMLGCDPQTPEKSIADNNFNSTLWVQNAAEYKANSLQAYNAARNAIDQAIGDVTWTAMPEQREDYAKLPPAIIMDVDETVLDNSMYQAKMVLEGTDFDIRTWDQWVAMRGAPGVPGAIDFINTMADKGVTVIYVTNRACAPRPGNSDECPQQQDTIENLKLLGVKQVLPKHVLLKNGQPEWTSEKQSRRAAIAKEYRVVMLFGDDLGDFLPNVKKNITTPERAELVRQYQANWGTKWFVFANPTYGSWLRVLDAPQTQHLLGY